MNTPRALDRRTGWLVVGVVASTVAAACLLFPWVALGRRRFSSLDLISSASALELLEGRSKLIVAAAWMVVPTLVAAGYVLAALGRHRSLACVLLPLGPIYVLTFAAVELRSPLRPAWGLHFAVVAGLTATTAGVALLTIRRT